MKRLFIIAALAFLGLMSNAQDFSPLRNPLEMFDGKIVDNLSDWQSRRNQISQSIQDIEIGQIPEVKKSQIKAKMNGDTLLVTITVGNNSLTLSSLIIYPKVGKAPYPLMIGTSHISLPSEIFDNRPIARLEYHELQVNGYSQFRGNLDKKSYGFVKLYPELIDNGAYSQWIWGFKRIIDALEILGEKKTKIDTKHIGVTGCSYAGKMALFCGAFDPRVVLTISQEPGGGGASAWRVAHTLEGVENLDNTDYHWFKESMKENFHGDSVYLLPHDHHELVSMVCPRALLVLGNTDYKWLADQSAYVSLNAARKVWQKFDIDNKFGYSIVGGHPHCQVPKEQYPEVEIFIDKFLLGKDVNTSNIHKAEMFDQKIDLSKWIKF